MTASSAEGPRPASAGLRRVRAQILGQLALMTELARGPEAELAARAPAVSDHHHHLKIVRDIRRARGLATAGLPSR